MGHHPWLHNLLKLPSLGILFALALLLLPSCGDRSESARLRGIAEAIGVKPDSALAMLNEVDTLTLNAADLHYFKLLSIKAADKAYLTHTSDSLIRQVIAYHEENPDTLLPEVYYYGGRVYSDLGDAPQALDYYQRALDLTDGDSAALNLRGNILSNMGQLMNRVYLYDQAIAHLKESAEIDSILGDLSGLHYDAQLLGHIYLNKEQEDSALYYYNKAGKVSRKLSQTENQTIQLLVTSTLRDKISPSEAKRIIYPIIADKSNPNRYLALGIGAYTYRKLGLRDSAEICAKALIAVNNDRLRLNGYASLVELYIDNPAETKKLYNAIRGYKENLNSVHGKTSSDAAIYQNSYYNYSLRERENNGLKAEQTKKNFTILILTISIFLLIILSLLILTLYKRKKLKLALTIARLEQLELRLSLSEAEPTTISQPEKATMSELKSVLDLKLKNITKKSSSGGYQVSPMVLSSSTYSKLRSVLETGETKSVSDDLWNELNLLINAAHPDFKLSIEILAGKISIQNYRISLLVKCGFTPGEIARLTNRGCSAISNSRMKLCLKVFGKKCDPNLWDEVIYKI